MKSGNKIRETEQLPTKRTIELFDNNEQHKKEIVYRNRMELELRESEEFKLEEREKKFKRQYEYLNIIIENMNELLLTYDSQAKVIFINQKVFPMLGYMPEEVKGHKFIDYVSSNRKKEVEGKIKERIKLGKLDSYETILVHKDGSERFVKLNVSPIIENGTITGGMILAEDITELKKVEQDIFRLDRINTIGEMAASITHELRNPLTTVRSFLQLLSGKQECFKYTDYYKLMIDELDRANYIISQYLSFTKNKPAEKKLQNLNTIIETIYPLLQASAVESDNYIELNLGPIPALLLDEKEIRQLLLNLARNGMEAMCAGGELKIATQFRGSHVVLSVQDQGQGITPEVLDKLGTPFITTKDGGTGLGLVVCYRIATRHNASIVIKSGNEGTTFEVLFNAIAQ